MRMIVVSVLCVAGLLGAVLAVASSPAIAALQAISIRTDTVPGTYTVSWNTRNRCDPGSGTSGASGSASATVTGGRAETLGVGINDICAYDWSAGFVNADGATCQIAASSLRITNYQMTLAVVANSCPRTGSREAISIRTDTVPGTYTVSWNTRNRCDPGSGTSGASGSASATVTGGRAETLGVGINDICAYDWSAGFVNADGATCQIAASSLRIANYQMTLAVVANSCPRTGSREAISIRTDTVPGTYTVSWNTRNRCDPGSGTSGASGSASATVTGGRAETLGVGINDICAYDWSAGFVNADGATCQIAASSLRIANYQMTLAVVANSCPRTGSREAISIRTDTVPGTYTVSWNTRNRCDPGSGTSGASGSASATVTGGRAETLGVGINDICAYDWSAGFVNADGATCQIAASSLRITNNQMTLAVVANSCPRTGSREAISIRTDTVPGTYTVSWNTRNRCDPGSGTSGASGSASATVTGGRAETLGVGINDICAYDWSAGFVNADGATCQIAASSLRIANYQMTLAVVPNSCPRTDRDDPPEATRPNVVRNLRLALSDENSFVITWDPPVDDGGSRITGYLLTVSRPDWQHSDTLENRSYRVNGLYGTTYTVRIVARNSIGDGAPVVDQITTLARPEPPPPQVTVLEFRRTDWGPALYWEPVSGTTQYEIDAREQPVDKPDIQSGFGCLPTEADCGYLFQRASNMGRDFREATIFRVRAVNDAGPGPWSRWVQLPASLAASPPPQVIVVRVRQTLLGPAFSWEPVSGATQYDIDAREEPVDRQFIQRGIRCAAARSECQTTVGFFSFPMVYLPELVRDFREAPMFRIRAVNDAGPGPWSRWVEVTRSTQRESEPEQAEEEDCPTGSKYQKEGYWFRRTRDIIALTSFETLDHNVRVNVGDQGGEVGHDRDFDNLKQSGCGWITRGSLVEHTATVSDNALVTGYAEVEDSVEIRDNAIVRRSHIYDRAKIYDNASVGNYFSSILLEKFFSERTRIYGDAHVYGEARVSGAARVRGYARVFGTAHVYGDTIIEGDARIFEDAHIYGNAKISGNAHVFGDQGTVGDQGTGFKDVTLPYRRPTFADDDHVWIYGEAEVFGDAWVFGNARVFGKAKVHGEARVYGTAVIFGNMDISDGVYDGQQEYARAAEAIYKEAYATVKSRLGGCSELVSGLKNPDEPDKELGELARAYLAPAFGVAGGHAKEEAYWLSFGCGQLEVVHEARVSLSDGGPWVFALTILLKMGSVARLPGFAAQLVKLADSANEIAALMQQAGMLEELTSHLPKAYDSEAG